jgi:hypothetical protein
VSQLNHRHFHSIVDICKSISFKIDLKSENTKSPWGFKFVRICWGVCIFLLQSHLVVRVKHNELELHIICNEWFPLSILFFINVDEIFNFNLTFVILWVYSFPLISFFIVSDFLYFQNSSFLKIPFD